MAIAFRSVSTRAKGDVFVTGSPVSVSLPSGHTSGDLLVLVCTQDSQTHETGPSGWHFLGRSTSGSSTTSTSYNDLSVYWKIDSGSEPTPSLGFSTAAYPVGKPYFLACILAYSGCHQSSPIVEYAFTATTDPAAAQVHPQLTTGSVNSWLATIRGTSGNGARTFTCSVGTDVSRVSDSDGFGEQSFAVFDSNTALSTGLQTQRTTTASGTNTWGSATVSFAIRPPNPTNAISAFASPASASGSAGDAASVSAAAGWDACAIGMPQYTTAIDWDGRPAPLNGNATFEYTNTGWTAFGGASFARSTLQANSGTYSGQITTGGSASPRIEASRVAVTGGSMYRASGWAYADAALPSGFSVGINWYTAVSGGSFISTSSNSQVETVGGWRYWESLFTAPATAAGAGLLGTCGGTPSAGIHVYVDDMRLEDPSVTDNLAVLAPGEDVTPDDLDGGITVAYGRDQSRQLSPTAVGTMTLNLNNSERTYSPENVVSPLAGNFDPAREAKMTAVFAGQVFPVFRGLLDDYTVNASRADRSVSLSFLDGMALLQGTNLSTPLYTGIRTGQAVGIILDAIGWTGPRDIDPGATYIPYWWVEGTDGISAMADLTHSEGPPAVAYVAPDGTFIFRDRHHRILRQHSVESQGTFAAGLMFNCASPAPTGTLSFTDPFTYDHGWRDIINSVTLDIVERAPELTISPVWSDSGTIVLGTGESTVINASTSDPFFNAQVPVAGTDFTYAGAGLPAVSLSRTSGAAVQVTVTAVGGPVVISGLQLQAKLVPAVRTRQVIAKDSDSVAAYGERSYPNTAPWAGANDAAAIAGLVLTHYAQRRPIVQLRIVSSDPTHWLQVVSRTLSDRITIRHDEMGLDSDFFVEHVVHTVSRMNSGRPPVHAVVLGCEQALTPFPVNPFTFDGKGAGFDQGVFDPSGTDNPAFVFIFDDSSQGQFDRGQFGT